MRLLPTQVGRYGWAFFLGPDKAGSSWIHEALAAHPRIVVPQAKDLFFFDRFSSRGIRWYLSHFEVSTSTKVCAEVCHDYLFDADAARRLADFAPRAKLLVCVRDPADRAVSSFLYMTRQGRVSGLFSEALRQVDELTDHGRYGEHLTNWLRFFPVEQLTVFDFEELRADPNGFATKLFEAVGVEPLSDLPARLHGTVRAASLPRSKVLALIGKKAANGLRQLRAESLLSRLKSVPAIESSLFRRLSSDERPPILPSDRVLLRQRLGDDTRTLDRILNSSYYEQWWGT